MNFAKTITGMVLISGLLAGCGQTSTTSNQPVSNQPQTVNTSSNFTEGTSGIQQSVTSMLGVTGALDKQISTGDQAKADASGQQLEATWHAFEDTVHNQYPSNYKDVETYLDPLVAGTKISPLDKQTLSNLNQKLQHALQSLQAKVK